MDRKITEWVRLGCKGGWRNEVQLSWSYRPALTALLLLVTSSEPFPQEGAPSARRGIRCRWARADCILIAWWRNLDGRELQVLFTALCWLPLALHMLHSAHLKTFAPKGCTGWGGIFSTDRSILIHIARSLHLQCWELQSFTHACAFLSSSGHYLRVKGKEFKGLRSKWKLEDWP